MDGNFEENIDLSEHISERLRRTAMLGRKPRSNRGGSHRGSSDYAALTSSTMKDKHLNQTANRSIYIQNRESKL